MMQDIKHHCDGEFFVDDVAEQMEQLRGNVQNLRGRLLGHNDDANVISTKQTAFQKNAQAWPATEPNAGRERKKLKQKTQQLRAIGRHLLASDLEASIDRGMQVDGSGTSDSESGGDESFDGSNIEPHGELI
jgi:hypothetical protein